MDETNLLSKAIAAAGGDREHGGLSRIADVCKVTYQAVRRWERSGRFPRTEHIPEELGGTTYAKRIASLPDVRVTADELRAWSLEGWKKK